MSISFTFKNPLSLTKLVSYSPAKDRLVQSPTPFAFFFVSIYGLLVPFGMFVGPSCAIGFNSPYPFFSSFSPLDVSSKTEPNDCF